MKEEYIDEAQERKDKLTKFIFYSLKWFHKIANGIALLIGWGTIIIWLLKSGLF